MRARALACLLLLAFATPNGARAEAPKLADVPVGIVRLLDDRGKAYVSDDRGLLAATLVPGAFAESQLHSFDQAKPLDFDRLTFVPSTQFAGNLASARIRAAYPGLEVATYQVGEESRIGGFDLDSYVEDSFFTFVRPAPRSDDPYDGWRMTSSSDLDPLAFFSARHMWDFGPMATSSSEHFLLLTHPDQVAGTNDVLARAEEGYQVVKKFWPRTIGSRYVIIAPSTTSELGELIQSTVDLEKFVAFAAGTVRYDEGYKPAGVRIYLHVSHVLRYDVTGTRIVLAHELIHAVTRPLAGPFMSSFVEEGLAMFGSEPEDKATARRGARDRFPGDDLFSTGSTRDIVTVYYQSQVAAAALAGHFGVEGVAKFYEALGRARVAPGTKDYQLARALKESVGWTVPDWVAAWKARLG